MIICNFSLFHDLCGRFYYEHVVSEVLLGQQERGDGGNEHFMLGADVVFGCQMPKEPQLM